MSFYIGILGAAILLLAFALSQLNKLKKYDITYDLMNVVGAIFLVIYAYFSNVWPFFVLNSVWAFFGLYDLWQGMNKQHHKRHHLLRSKHAR
jgi:hypothetical protein